MSKGLSKVLARAPSFLMDVAIYVPSEKELVRKYKIQDYIGYELQYSSSIRIMFSYGTINKQKIRIKENSKYKFIKLVDKALSFPFKDLFYQDDVGNLQMYEEGVKYSYGTKIGNDYFKIRPSVVLTDEVEGKCVIGLRLYINNTSTYADIPLTEFYMIHDVLSSIDINMLGGMLFSQALQLGLIKYQKDTLNKPKEVKEEKSNSSIKKLDELDNNLLAHGKDIYLKSLARELLKLQKEELKKEKDKNGEGNS